ncbi:MAG TPA: hypothetical protein VFS75_00625 [Candidatus Paceibacterota bacterium]|nr:hypothetical protein [Candidatus Paceibacterota bacterium]
MYVRDYVKAAYDVIEREGNVDKTLSALRTYLDGRGLAPMYPRILRGLAEEFRRRERTSRPVLSVARERDVARYEREIADAFARLGSSEKPAVEVNDNLIGGFVAEASGKRIDRSFKTKLLHAYQRLTAR